MNGAGERPDSASERQAELFMRPARPARPMRPHAPPDAISICGGRDEPARR